MSTAPVTFVAPKIGRMGGMERAMTELIEGLLAGGRQVTVISRICEIAPHPNLRFVRVRGPHRPASIAFPLFFLSATGAVLRHAQGLVHTQAAVVATPADVITVNFVHRALSDQRDVVRRSRDTAAHAVNELVDHTLVGLAERLAYRADRVRRVVAVGTGIASELERHFASLRGQVRRIPNGADLERFRPDPGVRQAVRRELGFAEDDRVAVFVGGDWDRKGLRHVVEALAEAPGWRLLVVGDGDQVAYAGFAADPARVMFVGRRSDPERYLAAGDAFTFPSIYEGFPLVAIEAAAVGLPLVTTQANGLEELVRPEVNGLFVGRDAASIAAALRRLDDTELRGRLGRGARSTAENYSWDGIVAAYEELYSELERTA